MVDVRHLDGAVKDDEHCGVCGRRETKTRWLEEVGLVDGRQEIDECVPVCLECLQRVGLNEVADLIPVRDQEGTSNGGKPAAQGDTPSPTVST